MGAEGPPDGVVEVGRYTLTTGQVGRALQIRPALARNWVLSGLLRGTQVDGVWLIDPASVDERREAINRAGWWRRESLSPSQADDSRRVATRVLVEAASAWRRRPKDPHLIEALMKAVDEREARAKADRPGGGESGG